MISPAQDKLVKPSYSSVIAAPRDSSPVIRQALVTEAENPVTAAKNNSTGTEMRNVSHLRVRNSRYIKPYKIETCSPETATT